MIVCVCHNISDRKIRQAVQEGMDTMPQLRDHLALGTCCGKCHFSAKQVLKACVAETEKTQPLVFHMAAMAA
jgi:bacterioferritin-associated ferredoxin